MSTAPEVLSEQPVSSLSTPAEDDVLALIEREEELVLPNGLRLFAHRLTPSSAHSRLLIVHGVGEHGGRYAAQARFFAERGFEVLIPDHRGHGRSSGPRGHVDSFRQYSEDLLRWREREPVSAEQDSPWFVWGHSMGGLITLLHLLDHPREAPQAAILTSPLLRTPKPVPRRLHWAARIAARLLPQLRRATGIDARHLSTDPTVAERYRADPLVYDKISVGWYDAMVAVRSEVADRIKEIEVPTLLFHSAADQVTGVAGSQEIAAGLGGEKELVILESGGHELHNEPDAERHLLRMADWFATHRSGGRAPEDSRDAAS